MSYQIKIDPKSRKAARFISLLQKKVQKAFVATGKTQQEVATILGVDRSVINRRLTGSANLTARSIAEFAYAFDKDIYIEFVDRPRVGPSNVTRSADHVLRLPEQYRVHTSGTISPVSEFNLEKIAS
ncbi:helix-turn-helix domain-containing protein [Roseovarius mucosus]|uniref:helix-turn-helix domain-containing protein n=1 Tax=Roseovarius mucosus TaxID=215743 RepID=UPI0011AF54BD|nr:helix-turn-helix transcriptional regulator [Roseovarius mucosus]